MKVDPMRITLPKFPVEGGCVCGALSYKLTAPPLYIAACHCLSCQCLSGSDYVLSMIVRRADFTLLTGYPSKCERTAHSGRILPGFFCPECGTRVWHEPAQTPQVVNIRAGTLDDPSWAAPVAHIWTQRMKPYVVVHPDALRFDQYPQPGDRQLFLDAWARAVGEKVA